jgi:hypothetical protein
MAQFWIAIFFILLAIVQLYQSIASIDLPLPVYLVLGTVLAVASNYQHKFSFIPAQQVKLEEIKTPEPFLPAPQATLAEIKASEPVLPAQMIPLLTATEPEAAPAQVEATAPKKSRPRKTTPKSKSQHV